MMALKVTTTLAASREAQLSTMSATWSSVASDSPRRSAHVVEYFIVTMSSVLSSGKQFCSGYSHGLNVGRLSCFHSSYSWQPVCSLEITFTHNAAATDDNLFSMICVYVQKLTEDRVVWYTASKNTKQNRRTKTNKAVEQGETVK